MYDMLGGFFKGALCRWCALFRGNTVIQLKKYCFYKLVAEYVQNFSLTFPDLLAFSKKFANVP